MTPNNFLRQITERRPQVRRLINASGDSNSRMHGLLQEYVNEHLVESAMDGDGLTDTLLCIAALCQIWIETLERAETAGKETQ